MSSWGVNPEEQRLAFPCDQYVSSFDAVFYRGVTIQAPAHIVFRWLCQLRVAPYSYDWIDNIGRESPKSLTPGLENLAVGQRMMVFRLVEFERDRYVTLQGESKIFGSGAGSYVVVPQGHDECRLLVKLLVKYPRGVLGLLSRLFLPWGDMILMRRQLLNFKELSEEAYNESLGSKH